MGEELARMLGERLQQRPLRPREMHVRPRRAKRAGPRGRSRSHRSRTAAGRSPRAGSAGGARGREPAAPRRRTASSGSRRRRGRAPATLPASSSRTDRIEDRDLAPAAEAAAHLEPADPGEVQVEHDEVGHRPLDLRKGLLAVRSRDDVVPPCVERAPERPEDLLLVVDDEDPVHDEPPTSFGTATAKVAPPPGVSSIQISPSIATTKPFAIASPNPAPSLGFRWSSS